MQTGNTNEGTPFLDDDIMYIMIADTGDKRVLTNL